MQVETLLPPDETIWSLGRVQLPAAVDEQPVRVLIGAWQEYLACIDAEVSRGQILVHQKASRVTAETSNAQQAAARCEPVQNLSWPR
jgi:hypothetical protein